MRILTIVIGSLLTVCGLKSTCLASAVGEYTGDGVIRDTSQRSIFFGSHAYMVTLASFPLNKPYEHTFRLDGLPTVGRAEAEIAFFVPNSFAQTRASNGRSAIEYSLYTTDGTRITGVKSTLGELIWSSPAHPLSYAGYALYHLDRSFFHPIAGQHYRLHVKYWPALGAGTGDGHFYIWSGVGGS